jgi:carbamoyltransferase
MNILGINAYHGDASAVLISDGQLVAAIEEERFRRIKHFAGFPTEAVRACLRIGGLEGRDIQHVGLSRNPRAHLFTKGLFALRHRPDRRVTSDRVAGGRRMHEIPETVAGVLGLKAGEKRPEVHWVEHHPAHLASAFFVSPFEEAAVCAIDGFGDFVSSSSAHGRGGRIDMVERTYFPHSLGMLYLAITQYLGFTNYGDESLVMGLAPYGAPDFTNEVARLVHLRRNGGFELDLSFFSHWSGAASRTWDDAEPKLARVFTEKLEVLLGPARREAEPLTAKHAAIAASVQAVFEDALFHVLNALHQRIPAPGLCLAGGCAMNSLANGKILGRTPFQELFIQPAAADSGSALGAAFWIWHQLLKKPRRFVMKHAYWGPDFQEEEVHAVLSAHAAELEKAGCLVSPFKDTHTLTEFTADRIAKGQIVGWFQGRMEWGACALGNRSILADPRRADMRDVIGDKLMLSEKSRPFGASVLEESHASYIADAVPDPFMMQVYPLQADKRAAVPAVADVDGSARLQSVRLDSNPLYWELIRAFERRTGIPMVLNASFNENEPIVRAPGEALGCFLRTRMDVLVLGNTVVTKADESADHANRV